jgi:hypothetical protein
MRTVVEIDQLIGQAKKTAAKLQSDKAKNLALIETAKNIRARNSLSALSSEDAAEQVA